MLRTLMNASKQSYVPPYSIALVHLGLGGDVRDTRGWLFGPISATGSSGRRLDDCVSKRVAIPARRSSLREPFQIG